MDFELDKTHALQRELYRKFAETEIKPLAHDMDETEVLDMELMRKMQKQGFFGIPYSRDYGGEGMDYLSYSLCMEEVSKQDASSGITISVHTSLCCGVLNYFATEEQKQKFLRPLVDGSKFGCFGLTEPGAGSDAAGVATKAKKEGDHYVINGSKIFTTNSGFADYCTVFALTNPELGTKGMSCFLVDLHTPGVDVSANIQRCGIRAASNCVVSYDNVIVPEENLIGKEGEGFKIAMVALDGGRIGIASQAVGIAQGALDETIKYVKERKQFGKPIAAFQNTQFQLADMQTKIDAARLLTWKAAVTKDRGEKYSVPAAEAKLFASAVAAEVTRECVQLMGGYGYCREYPVERMYRDAKITEIYEGTSEVMRMVISGGMKLK